MMLEILFWIDSPQKSTCNAELFHVLPLGLRSQGLRARGLSASGLRAPGLKA